MENLKLYVVLQLIGFLGLLAFGFIFKLIQWVNNSNMKAKEKRDLETKEILDEFESSLLQSNPYHPPSEVSTPKVVRDHATRLTIIEEQYDLATALATPKVVIQFNPNSRKIELRLYVREFYRGGGSTDCMFKSDSFELSDMGQAVKHAWSLYKEGFATREP